MLSPMSDSERRWLNAVLVLGTMVLAIILIGQLGQVVAYFGDILLIFFLAWLLAFILSPIPATVERWMPRVPRILVVVGTYAVLLVGLVLVTIVAAQALAGSITGFIDSLPAIIANLPQLLAPWQRALDEVGLRVDLLGGAQSLLQAAGSFGGNLVRPLTDLALASLSIFGNLALVIIFSLYIVQDRDRMLDFVARLVPPRYASVFRLLRTSVARSFGGFLRGQAILGIVYGVIAFATHMVLGLQFAGASAVLAGLLMAIPFFGPFLGWAPPVLVAVFTSPDQIVPAFVITNVGQLIEMNVLQPRLMAGTVGIHPLVVLGSVIVGAKLAGIPGAIFSVPIAAVISNFFFHYLNRTALGSGDVTTRAARVVEAREGRRIRRPRPPSGADDEGAAAPTIPAAPG
ncbi:MAG: AI-2E family transporter [Candidatus Limnocylindrales bacterium]